MNTNKNTLIINSWPVEVVRKKVKKLYITVHPPDGRLRVTAPEVADEQTINFAITSRLSWIQTQKKAFQEQPRQSEREMITGESHYYLGQKYRLKVCYTPKANNIKVPDAIKLINKKTMLLTIRPNAGLKDRQQILSTWYRQQLNNLLPDIINKWEARLGFKISAYGIRRMKTKWGSCNHKQKKIWLNLELIKKPIHCLEYIVVHEMVHILEPTHNKKFARHMDQFMPRWRLFRRELNQSPLEAWA